MSEKIVVLVVEDEPLIRMDVVCQLEDEGYYVLEAATADQAVAILEAESSIRVLFTDIDMPGSMDGLELAAMVYDRWPPMKILVTSGHRKIQAADLPAGSVFFSKPYRHSAVMASFHELLPNA